MEWFAEVHAWTFETLVEPALYQLGMTDWLDSAFDATEIFLLGCLQIVLAMLVLRPLERWRPLEADAPGDGRLIRPDVWYTLLNRTGLVPLILFFLFTPVAGAIEEWTKLQGITPFVLDERIPALADRPLLTFVLYLLILDFAQYLYHRAQHGFRWWWQLHALHHDQRRMTFWSDDRNHFLDVALSYAVFVGIALAIGVPPGQFILLTFATRFIESWSHVNARLPFGWLGERLVVSPRYHRRHHAVLESGARQGVNFAIWFPIWDMLFGTADFSDQILPTGIDAEPGVPDYRGGVLTQQWIGLRRLVASVRA